MTQWNDATKYMRIAAVCFFVYDWALTLPAEIRLYRRHGIARPSIACILLILVRYLGAIALTFNILGFFGHFFDDIKGDVCRGYYRVMPITQCLASWASHVVFVLRTCAILSHGRAHVVFLSTLAVVVCAAELIAQLWSFSRFLVGSSGNCLIQYSKERNISYVYYLVRPKIAAQGIQTDLTPLQASCIFDVAVLALTYRGLALRHAQETQLEAGRSFHAVLWHSSLVYFVVTTFVNLLNLGFYAAFNNSNATVLGPMGIAMTSMMSARVILNLHDYAQERRAGYELSGPRSQTSCRWRSLSLNDSGVHGISPLSPAVRLAVFDICV
ncbi:hypothetical protein HDZ31DRAFT_44783 [Schizophyllum fasciatum]